LDSVCANNLLSVQKQNNKTTKKIKVFLMLKRRNNASIKFVINLSEFIYSAQNLLKEDS